MLSKFSFCYSKNKISNNELSYLKRNQRSLQLVIFSWDSPEFSEMSSGLIKINCYNNPWEIVWNWKISMKHVYRILRKIGRYFFPQHAGFDLSSTSTYTMMKLKKSGIPKKNRDKNDDFVYSIPLFCCRFFFLNKIEIIDALGVVFFLNKAIKVYY